MSNKIELFLRALGKPLVKFISSLGDLTIFIAQSVYNCLTPPFYFKLMGKQLIDIGFYSLPVVGLTTIFAGMVIALQSYTGFARFGAESGVASVVLISVTRELAPALSGLMVAGRIGAAMAAEIGTMRVTEQIDAMEIMGVNSANFLILPKMVGMMVFIPVLVIFSMFTGILGGIAASYSSGTNMTPAAFEYGLQFYFNQFYIWYSIIKSVVYAFIISSIAAYFGYNVKGGALEVGKASTNAVVMSSIMILLADVILTNLMLT